MAQQWYAQFDGRTVGPFPAKKLRDLANAGTLTPDTQLRIDEGAWFPAARVKGLFDVEVASRSRVRDDEALVESQPVKRSGTAETHPGAGSGEYDWTTEDDFPDDEAALDPPPMARAARGPTTTAAIRAEVAVPQYVVLRIYAIVLIVLGGLPIAVSLLLIVLALIGESVAGLAVTLVWFAVSLAFGVACLVASELLHAVIHVATDARRSRLALERIERRISDIG